MKMEGSEGRRRGTIEILLELKNTRRISAIIAFVLEAPEYELRAVPLQ
jgi:hypothetical protein